jgi:hypothetical protein
MWSAMRIAGAAALGLVLLGVGEGRADELTLAGYCAATVARLQLADDTWRAEHRAPVREEETTVLRRHGTEPAAYYAYTSAHREEIAAYLASHPMIRDEIDRLSRQVRARIEREEPR